jgi:RNA polymerase sigma factor (sigma-70 family)
MTPEQLFESSARHVRVMARKIHSAEASRYGVEVDDLQQVGLVAMWDTARRFDESRGCVFATLAWPRVRGAMLDLLRQARGRWWRRAIPQSIVGRDWPGRDRTFDEAADLDEHEWLRRQVANLSPQCSRVMGRLLDGERGASVARELGVSPEAVQKQKDRGVRLIRAKAQTPQGAVFACNSKTYSQRD